MSRTPDAYVEQVRTAIVFSPVVSRFQVVREIIEETIASYRYRIGLEDGSLLEMAERVEIITVQQ